MSIQVLVGNSLEVLPTLEKNSVHCSVTSPPYYGLRKYQGDQQCDWPKVEYSPMPGLPPITVEPMTCALGHEPTIEAYVGHLVAIYREVWQVLRDDGVAWIVMGDSYATSPPGRKPSWSTSGLHGAATSRRYQETLNNSVQTVADKLVGLGQGNLMLVPHRLALALQADGWLIRNDVVWAKKAPMPESVAGWRWQRHRVRVKKSDRATNPFQEGAGTRQGAGVASRAQREAYYEQGKGASKWIDCPGCPKCEANDGYVLKRGSWRHTRAHEFVFMLAKGMQYFADQEKVREALENLEQSRNGRNPRSVLSPSPEPFSGSHFAVFPTGLIEPLIKATCPDKCCPECGAGWSPVVERKTPVIGQDIPEAERKDGVQGQASTMSATSALRVSNSANWNQWKVDNPDNILGYRPTCGCGRDDHVPGVCLDLFFGAGTVGLVCDRLGLDCIGIDISEKYAAELAAPRIRADAPLFAVVSVRAGV